MVLKKIFLASEVFQAGGSIPGILEMAILPLPMGIDPWPKGIDP